MGTTVLSVIIISPNEKFRDDARELLKGSDHIDVTAELRNFDSAPTVGDLTKSRDLKSSIFIVDVTDLDEAIEKTIEFFRQSYVFVAGDRKNLALVLRCMRAGAKEFLTAPLQGKELFPAIERVRKVIPSRSR